MADHDYGLKFTADIGQASDAVKRLGAQVNGMSKNLKGGLEDVKHSFKGLGEIMSNPYALLGGAGMALVAKRVSDVEDHMTTLQIETGATTDQIMRFKEGMYATSMATGASLDKMMDLSMALGRATHDFEFVNQEMGFFTKVQQATGMSGEELGEAMGRLHEKTGLAGKDIEDLTKQLYAFGQTKGVPMDFKAVIPQVDSLVGLAKSVYGKNATMAQIGDVIMTQMMLGPKVNFNRSFMTALKKAGGPANQFLAPLGINFSKELEKGTKISDLLLKIMRSIRGTPVEQTRELGKLLGFKQGTTEYTNLERMAEAIHKINANKLDEDATKRAGTFSASMERLSTAGTLFADKALSGALDTISKAISEMVADPAVISSLASAIGGLAKAMALIVQGSATFVAAWGNIFSELGGSGKVQAQEAITARIETGTKMIETARRLAAKGKKAEARQLLEQAKRELAGTQTAGVPEREEKRLGLDITVDRTPRAKEDGITVSAVTAKSDTGAQHEVGVK